MTSDKNPTTIADRLIDYFSKFGTPREIISDNGTEFKNKTICEILKLYKIKIHFTTTGHHESNSLVERLHSTLIEHMRILKLMDKNVPTEIAMNRAIIAYNSSINPITKLTLFDILFGRTRALDPINLAYQEKYYEDYVNKHKEFTRAIYDAIHKLQQSHKEKVISKHNEEIVYQVAQ